MMRKKWRKISIVFILIGVVSLSINLLLNRGFKTQAIELVREQIKDNLLTEISIKKSDIRFTIFHSFPNASLELKDILVKSPYSINFSDFKALNPDTLLFAQKIYLEFNLLKLIKKDYELQKIVIKDGILNIFTDQRGNNNLKIWKKKEAEADTKFKAALKTIESNQLRFRYYDLKHHTDIELDIVKATTTGNLSGENIRLKSKSTIDFNKLLVDQSNYFYGKNLKLVFNLEFNQKNISFDQGSIKYQNIPIAFSGNIDRSENHAYQFTLNLNGASLNDLNKTILHQYIKQAGIKPLSGDFTSRIKIHGIKKPNIDISYKILEAKIAYLKTDQSFNMPYLKGNYSNGRYKNKLSSSVAIDSLSLAYKKCQVQGKLSISNFVRPVFSANLWAINNIAQLNELLKTNSLSEVTGTLKYHLETTGQLPGTDTADFKNAVIKSLKASVTLDDIEYTNPHWPTINIAGDMEILGTNHLVMNNISIHGGTSDILVNGSAKNFLTQYKIGSSFPEYNLQLTSNTFIVDEFLAGKSDDSDKPTIFPDSINISGNFSTNNFQFGKFQASAVSGSINYKSKNLQVQNFKMNSCEGKVVSNLSIKQSQNETISIDGIADFSKVNVKLLFSSFNNFGQDVILDKHLAGRISSRLNLKASWTNMLRLEKENLWANTTLLIEDGELIEYPPMMGLARFIEVDELERIEFDRFSTEVSIARQNVLLSKTNIRSSIADFSGSGEHSFNNEYEYHLQIVLADILWNKAKKRKKQNNEFGYVVDDGLGKTTLPIVIYGKGTDFQYDYDKRVARKSFREKLNDEKKELKELFSKDDKEINSENESDQNIVNIAPETDQKEEKKTESVKTNQDVIEIETDEYKLQWDPDAEEEEEEPEFR